MIRGRPAAFVVLATAIMAVVSPANGQFNDPVNWSTFDAGENGIGTDPDGYHDAVFNGGYFYFVQDFNGSGFHSEVLRYDTRLEFAESTSWSAYDPTTDGVGRSSASFAGGVFDGTYVYFVPNNDDQQYGEVMRYDPGLSQAVPTTSAYGLAAILTAILIAGVVALRRSKSVANSQT